MKANIFTKHSEKSRRKFLKNLGLGLTATGLAPLSLNARPATAHYSKTVLKNLASWTGEEEAYWAMVKKQFMIRPGMIMANAANLCPCPHFVNERVFDYTQKLAGDVSFQNRNQFKEGRQQAIERLAGFLKVDAAEIGITRNTSESNNIIVNGLDFGPGDEVLIWDQNHPTNHIAWEQRAKRNGFTVKKVSVPPHPSTSSELLEAFTRQVSAQTRMLAFSHISNVSGIALPVKELCTYARSRNILTLVDGAQSLGFLDLDLKDLGCDFYSSSTHKWLMGPMENGVLYVRKERIGMLWPNIIAAGWSEDHQTLDEKVCVLGQRNTPSTPAIVDILDFHEAIGTKKVETRVRYLNAYLKEQIQKRLPQASFVTPLESDLSGGITILGIPGTDPRKLFQQLYEQHGIAGAPTGGLRLSPHIYCTANDMDRIAETLVVLAS